MKKVYIKIYNYKTGYKYQIIFAFTNHIFYIYSSIKIAEFINKLENKNYSVVIPE